MNRAGEELERAVAAEHRDTGAVVGYVLIVVATLYLATHLAYWYFR